MPLLSAQRQGFVVSDVYRLRRPSFLTAAKQRLSFLIAVLSLLAFVTGNMVGQHGWYAFWRTVFGKDEAIFFTGTVPPIARVPDFERWSRYGGSTKEHTYRQVPEDILVPLPRYDESTLRRGTADALMSRVYSVGNLGDYETGHDHAGSHVGVDIAVPIGTPVLAIANGIVEKTSLQSDGYGHYVMIRHPNVPDPRRVGATTTLWSIYAHLDAILVREGQIVTKGQNIATSGDTGFASGPHLHFQIDNADAPFHPYWPFTGEEQRAAGFSFTQAINAGLHQERGIAYTESPLLFVQAHTSYVAPVIAAKPSSPLRSAASSVASLTPAERVALRRSTRLASRPSVVSAVASSVSSVAASSVARLESVTVSSASSEPLSVAVNAPSVDTIASMDSSTPSGSSTDVATLRFDHSGVVKRSWQRVQVLALDREGKIVKSPVFSGRVYLRTTFGDAEIRPSELSSLDFVNGIATVQVLTRSDKTAIVSARGAFTVDSAPMVAAR